MFAYISAILSGANKMPFGSAVHWAHRAVGFYGYRLDIEKIDKCFVEVHVWSGGGNEYSKFIRNMRIAGWDVVYVETSGIFRNGKEILFRKM